LLKRLGEHEALALLTAVEEKQPVFRIFGIWDQMKEALIKKDVSELDKLLTQFKKSMKDPKK
jgi:hypothetical protein